MNDKFHSQRFPVWLAVTLLIVALVMAAMFVIDAGALGRNTQMHGVGCGGVQTTQTLKPLASHCRLGCVIVPGGVKPVSGEIVKKSNGATNPAVTQPTITEEPNQPSGNDKSCKNGKDNTNSQGNHNCSGDHPDTSSGQQNNTEHGKGKGK